MNPEKRFGQFYKVLLSFVICLISFSARQVMAGSNHSFSAYWATYDESVTVGPATFTFEPNEYGIDYHYLSERGYSFNAGHWRDSDTWSQGVMDDLESKREGWSTKVTFEYDRFWLDAGISISESTLSADSSTTPNFYDETSESKEVQLGYGYYLDVGPWFVTPSIQLAFQMSDVSFRGRSLTIPVISGETEEEGGYVTAGLGMTYPYAFSSCLFMFNVSGFWSEGVFGDGLSRVRIDATRDALSSSIDAEPEASGHAGAGVSFLFDHISLDASIIEPIDNPTINTKYLASFGVTF